MDGLRVLSSEASLGGVLEECRLHPENLAPHSVQIPSIRDLRPVSFLQPCLSGTYILSDIANVNF